MKKRILLVICVFLVRVHGAYPFSGGPPADRNGLNGLYCTACHRTNELNSSGGSVSVTGLPSAWIPGTVYALKVVIVREGSARWGFEMSAVDGGGQQAGEFIAGPDGRSRLITGPDANGREIQFIEHNSVGTGPGGTNTYEFSYRAPSNASVGDIRFNLAGNAANGNGANTGDFIYAIQIVIPTAQTSSRILNLAARGAASTITDGRAPGLVTGHARLQATGGGSPLAALGLLAFRPGGTLVSEAAISGVAAIQSGRFPVEVGTGVNTGIAIANPGTTAATVTYFMNDSSGSQSYSGSVVVPANGQIAAFIDQPTFYTPGPFRQPISDARTMTFGASVPVAVLAVRGRTNERSDFLISPVPISDMSVSSTETAYIPHFADGGGWSTQVVLTNPSDDVISGSVQFFGQNGQMLTLTVNGQSVASSDYSIPARTSKTFQTSGAAALTALGFVRISPATRTRTPAGFAVLISRRSNVTVSEISVPAVTPASAYRLFVENSGNFGAQQPGAVQTAFVAANPSSTAITLNLEVTAMDGTSSRFTGSISVPAQGQVLAFLNQVDGLSSLPSSFQGALRVSTSAASGVSVVGIRSRYNERTPASELIASSVPATNEAAPPSTADLVIPHIADSGGYVTQFVVLSSPTGASSAVLRLFDQSGGSLNMTLR